MKTYGLTLEDQYDATDSGVLSRDLGGLLHAGDRRWTFPTPGRDRRRDARRAEGHDRSPALAAGPIEVVVVGDITVDKAIEAVAETFGALPKRPDPDAARAAGARAPASRRRRPARWSRPTPAAPTRASRYVAWPTTDFFDRSAQAPASTAVLGAGAAAAPDRHAATEGGRHLLAERRRDLQLGVPALRLHRRRDGGAAGRSWTASSPTSPTIAADLRDKPVTADELERAKKPAIEALEKATATNEYWLDGLAGAQADPRRLDALRSAEPNLESVSADDVQKAAQTYLRDDTAWKLEIKPKARAARSAATP